MKRMLRKGHEKFSVEFKNSDYTHNLTTAEVCLDIEAGVHTLYLSVGHNLASRTGYVQSDARDLLGHARASTIDTVQISDRRVIDGFDMAIDDIAVPQFFVVLDFGAEGQWKTEVGPRKDRDDLWLRFGDETVRL
jgi:hypothetical protein